MRIALDVMGGDNAPNANLDGALMAVERGFVDADQILLVGDEAPIARRLGEAGKSGVFEIVHFPEVVEMHEEAMVALKRKPNASITGCIQLVREGKAEAIVTAGHTGAAVFASTIRLDKLKGIKRTGLAITFHGPKGPTTVVDVGANLKCKPVHLFQYGLMGSCFARTLDIESPRIGLLNIGAEDEKGNLLVKETHELYRDSGLNFIGNLEGQDVFTGKADVIVCEGFVGNVVLKVSEGLCEYLMKTVLETLGQPPADDGARKMYQRAAEAVGSVAARIDFTEYGGALLLGVDGIVIIGHGRSDAKAIASALRAANRFVTAGVNKAIVAGLAGVGQAH